MSESAVPALLPSLKPLAAAAEFESLAKLCALVAAGKRPAAESSNAAAAAGLPVATPAALVSFFMEAARIGGTVDDFTNSLSAVLPEDRARTIAALASEGQPAMRSVLASLSLGPDELVDVSWQRAVVAAAGHEQPRAGGVPLYTITLTTRAADGSLKQVQFTASSEDLADLVRELKNAMRLVEREAS